MLKCVRALIPLLLLFSLMAAPASATEVTDEGRFFAYETGFTPGDAIPAGRCPAQAMWMLHLAGFGEMREFGTFTSENSHCSWVVEPIPGGAEGALGNGSMVLTFDDTGDQLFVAYEGKWRFVGDLSTGLGQVEIRQTVTFAGGTGIFDGASGHGRLDGHGLDGLYSLRFSGAIELAD